MPTEPKTTMTSVDADAALDGILLVDKPGGISSARAVAIVKRVLGGVRTGHLGTLDPFASGLLPLCVGEGTKTARYLNLADKSYTGTVRLGITTDTLDRTGEVTSKQDVPTIDDAWLETLEKEFTGTFEQVPPAFSAIKNAGVRSYKRARAGDVQEPPARIVRIDRLSVRAQGSDLLSIEVDCSKGTYIRSLARDIGARLGCGGLLESLTRTRFSPFVLGDAVGLDVDGGELAVETLRCGLVTVEQALAWMPAVEIDERTENELRCGRQGALQSIVPAGAEPGPVRMMKGLALVAVASPTGPIYKLDRIFKKHPGSFTEESPQVGCADIE